MFVLGQKQFITMQNIHNDPYKTNESKLRGLNLKKQNIVGYLQ